MHSTETGAPPYAPAVPSMLDLVRLSARRLFPPGGEELYRQIALLTDMKPGLEVLDVASGKGVPLEYFVTEFGVTASGVEIDPSMVEEADSWSRELGAGDRRRETGGARADDREIEGLATFGRTRLVGGPHVVHGSDPRLVR